MESTAYAYYLKGRKTIGNHNLSITTFGAPQRHGQRSADAGVRIRHDIGPVPDGSTGLDDLRDIIDNSDSTDIVNRGRGFNENIVNYQEVYYEYNEETGQIEATYGENRSNNPEDGMRRYNSRQNFYFKPIVTVRDGASVTVPHSPQLRMRVWPRRW